MWYVLRSMSGTKSSNLLINDIFPNYMCIVNNFPRIVLCCQWSSVKKIQNKVRNILLYLNFSFPSLFSKQRNVPRFSVTLAGRDWSFDLMFCSNFLGRFSSALSRMFWFSSLLILLPYLFIFYFLCIFIIFMTYHISFIFVCS